MRTCTYCGANVEDGNKFCGSCGTPVDQGSFKYAGPVAPDGVETETVSYDQPDTIYSGQAPFSNADTVDYDQAVGGTGATENVGSAEGAGFTSQPYNPQPSYAPTGFKMPTGVLIWSIIMIFLSGIPGIVATVFSVQAKTQPTKAAYDHKVKVAKIWNIVGVVLCIIGFLFVLAVGCIAVNYANDENFDYDSFVESLNELEDEFDEDLSDYEEDAEDSDNSGAGSGSEASSGAGAQGALSWPSDCSDENGNPTMFACLALSGTQLKSYLEEQGYEQLGASMVKGTRTWGVMGEDKELLPFSDVAKLEAAGGKTPVCYVYNIDGYKTAQKALKGNSKCDIEDSATVNNGAMAIISGPSKRECLAIVSMTSKTNSVLIFNEAAVKKGLFKDLVGDFGSSIDEVWDTVVGRKPGK